ncbi:MAG: GHKL domain-containing protein [Bacilli bacterium]
MEFEFIDYFLNLVLICGIGIFMARFLYMKATFKNWYSDLIFYNIITLIIVVIDVITINPFIIKLLNNLIFFFLIYLYANWIEKVKISKVLIIYLLTYYILLITEYLQPIISTIFPIFNNYELFIITICFTLLIIYIFSNSNIVRIINYYFYGRINKNFCILTISIFTIFLFINIYLFNNEYIDPVSLSIFGFLFVLFFIFYLIFSYILFKYLINLKYNEDLITRLKQYEELVSEERINNHEHKNQLFVASTLIKTDIEAKKYLQSLVGKQNMKLYNINELRYIKNDLVKNIIANKMNIASNKEIKINIFISRELEKFGFESLKIFEIQEYTKILGVLLDNSIEAAGESENKQINLEMKIEYGNMHFIITNSYLSIKENMESTKGDRHGYGLKLIRRIINSSECFMIRTDKDDEMFMQELILLIKTSS